METLESRTLLSITPSAPFSIAGVSATWESYDATGHLWVYDTAGHIVDTSGTININIASVNANGFAMGTGHIFVSDARGGIDDVDFSNPANITVSYKQLVDPDANPEKVPTLLTVTPSAVYFTGPFTTDPDTERVTNVVGRWVPGASSADFITLDSSFNDSTAAGLTPDADGGVWIGMVGNYFSTHYEAKNHIAKVDFAGSLTQANIAVDSGDPAVDANNLIQSVASDGNGGLWYNLTRNLNDTSKTASGLETFVHLAVGPGGYTQTGYQLTNDLNDVLNTRFAGFDSAGSLWFYE